MIKLDDGRKVTVVLPRYVRVDCLCSPGPRQPVVRSLHRGKRRIVHCDRLPGGWLSFAGKCKKCGRMTHVKYDIKPIEEIPEGITQLDRRHLVEHVWH